MKNKHVAFDIIAAAIALASLITAICFGVQANSISQRMMELEEQVIARAIIEDIKIKIEASPEDLLVFMGDSDYCYDTKFEKTVWTNLQTILQMGESPFYSYGLDVRLPAIISIYNNSDMTVTIAQASLYAGNGRGTFYARGAIGGTTFPQEKNYSIAPGEARVCEVDVCVSALGLFALDTMQYMRDAAADADFSHIRKFDETTPSGTTNSIVSAWLQEAVAAHCVEYPTDKLVLEFSLETARGTPLSETLLFLPAGEA